ncbi:hypothetical protein ABWW58_06150 [Sporolactobacillus sp. STCC-11]|uniref:hypothetical protein n=1 Tax=Sporolactobacillus caesalpiniae TaxID=3230362 RepID=UPI003394941A
MKKSLSIIENTVAFIVITILNINWSWIIYDELRLIVHSSNPLNYTAYVFNRSVTLPLVIVAALNFMMRRDRLFSKWLICLFSVLLLELWISIGRYLSITHFVKWNVWYDGLYLAALHWITYMILKGYHHLMNKEVHLS